MSSVWTRLGTLAANLTLVGAAIPRFIAFVISSINLKTAQGEVLRRQRRARCGKEWTARPPAEYEAQGLEDVPRTGRLPSGEPIIRLVPTSGTTGAIKLIPYTAALLDEMRRAFDPWLARLYLACPSLLHGKHYWSLSPNTRVPHPPSKVPVGFGDDTHYLSSWQRRALRRLLAVPPEVAQIDDPDAFNFTTLLFLARERNLRLISVWHPSFLTLLLDSFVRHREAVVRSLRLGRLDGAITLPQAVRKALDARLAPEGVRASQLEQCSLDERDWPSRIWPHCRVISCWTEGRAEAWVRDLEERFPRSMIQPKGLLATEGVVTIPWGLGGRRVCAGRSHFLEFLHEPDRALVNAWQLEDGHIYSVLLTTAGGLVRYALHDRVRVQGHWRDLPVLQFLGRDNRTCDQVGEKVTTHHAEDAIEHVARALGRHPLFAMLTPGGGLSPGYVLYWEPNDSPATVSVIRTLAEGRLNGNLYYRHARQHGQLAPLRVCPVHGAAEKYRRRLMERGVKAGDIKFEALRLESDWEAIFERSARPPPP